MKELFTDWIVNLTLVSVLSSLILKLLPGKTYEPHIRIICGIMMILTLIQPVLQVTGLEKRIDLSLAEEMYEIERKQMENELIRMEEEQKRELEQRYQEYLEEQSDGREKKD